MSDYRRVRIPGACYFFTVVTAARRPILTEPRIRLALREAIHRVRLTRPFAIHAWVLLPDHLHTIWQLPEGDDAYAIRWRLIKGSVTHACESAVHSRDLFSGRRRRKHCGTIWQARYWEHMIRDRWDLQRHLDYVHWNPVKHGLSTQVADWPWSSFHRYAHAGIYPPDWGGCSHSIHGDA